MLKLISTYNFTVIVLIGIITYMIIVLIFHVYFENNSI
jgi:hypothetical protein